MSNKVALTSWRTDRLQRGTGGKANAPGRVGLWPGASPWLRASLGFAPLELRLALGLLSRRLTPRLDAGLAARRRGQCGRWLGPRWSGRRGLRSALRRTARLDTLLVGSNHARRLRPDAVRAGQVRPNVLRGPVGALAPLGSSGSARVSRAIGAVEPIPLFGVVGAVRTIPVVWTIRVVWMIRVPLTIGAAPPALVVTVVRRITGDGARPWTFPRKRLPPGDGTRALLDIRRWYAATQVPSAYPHLAAAVVVHRTLRHARDEQLRGLPVLEDEPRLRSERTREGDPCTAVGLIGVVVGVVEHDDPETDAAVIVRAPVGVAHVRVAVVAQEPRVIVVLLHVVGDDVVVPVGVAVRDDVLGDIGERDVRIAAHPPIRDEAVVPVIFSFDGVVYERVGRRDGEDVADPRVVVDVERVPRRPVLHFIVATAAREVVVPRLARIQDAHPTVGVDAQDGHVGVLLGAETDLRRLAVGVRIIATVGPDLDAGTVIRESRLRRGRAVGSGEQAEDPQRGEHVCLPAPLGARSMPRRRPTLEPISDRKKACYGDGTWLTLAALSSTRDSRRFISFRHAWLT